MKKLKENFKLILLISLSLQFWSCSSNDNPTANPAPLASTNDFIRAADVSYLPLIESEGTIFKYNGNAENALTTLKNSGCNTIRIRLWKDPSDIHSSLTEVKTFSIRAKNMGFKVWLSVHYSDTWADEGSQTKPAAWQSLSFVDLKAAIISYTTTVINEIHPDIIQIGNETNDGMLWPQGKLTTNESQYLQLVQSASSTIRTLSPTTKIMLHYAGIGTGATWYFNKVSSIDYDYIGLSFYPIWHGKILSDVSTTINSLGQTFNKKVIIAETAYPFTFGYSDNTNNILGLQNQIIPDYPATIDGQRAYLLALKSIIKQTTNGIGFCYWEAEWVAFRGPTSTNGSSWENQSLWDFNNNALPAMDVFNAN